MKGSESFVRRITPLRLVLLALALAANLFAGPFDAWNCHMQVTVNGYQDYEALSNFPLLVALSTNLPGFNYKQFAQSNGGDLRFTDGSGTQELNYEVDTWDPHGTSYVWVKIPMLQGTYSTNYFDGQWVKNWSWTGEPIIAHIYPNGVLWAQYLSDAGNTSFADPGWMGADSYPIRYQSLFADKDPATGWTYADRAPNVTTRAWNTDGELIGTWMYTTPPLSDREVFVRFYNGYRYAAKADGSFWAAAMFGVLIDAQHPSLYVTNKADMLAFCDFDPRTTANPYDAPVFTTNTVPVSIIAHWGNPSATAPAYTTNGGAWSSALMGGVWHMREAAAQDSKRSASAGTPNNVTVTNGRIGSALAFNPAQNSSVSIASFSPGFSGNASYTLEGWFCRTANNGANVCYGNGTALQAVGIGVDGSGHYTALHAGSDETFDNSSFGNGQWQHVVVVHHGGDDNYTELVYVNGRYSNSRGNSSGSGGPEHNSATCLNVPSSAALSFGKSPWTTDYCGQQLMDEVRIHKTERTYNWIRASYKTVASNSTFQTYGAVQGLTNALYGGTNPPGAFQFASAACSVSEIGRYVDVTVQRPASAGSNVSVHVASVGGTAVAGSDYVAVSTDLGMADGVNTASVRIPVANNAAADGSRTITLALSNPTGGATITSPSNAVVTITDDDPATDPAVAASYGSIWKYSDSGTDLGTAWRGTGYSDSGWALGPGPLGYNTGNPDEPATTLGYGDDSTNKHITTYFRKTINISDASAIGGLSLKFRADDGVVLYVNGAEAGRYLMTNGAYGYQTMATSGAPGEKPEQTVTVTSGLLTGANVIAAEVHQVGPGSSDIYFDMQAELMAQIASQPTFTAYNDCAWTASSGQSPSANDVTGAFTTNSPLALLNGYLVNTNGVTLPVQVTFTTNSSTGLNLLDRALSMPAGTDVDAWFKGRIGTNCAANWASGSIQMNVTGLDATKLYNIVLWSTRGADGANYSNRFTDIRISGADAFVNRSSAGAEQSTVSMANDQTRVRSALAPGLVARYDSVNPGSDGGVTFILAAGADALYPASGPYATNGYLNAFMIQTSAGGSGPVTVPDAWKIQYFGMTNVNMNSDPDGDGRTLVDEYVAGSNPNDSSSKPTMRLGLRGGVLNADFGGVTQRLYSIDVKTNLFAPWMPLVTDVAGSNATQYIALGATNGAHYYRFRVRMAP